MVKNVEVKIDELAKRQLRDYDAHRPGSLFQQPAFNLTIDEAYALQFEVARLREARGEAIVGYKVGCASPTIQVQLGIAEPVFGHIFETELHRSEVTLDPMQYDCLALEGEFAVRMGWRGAAASIFAVIELHNYVVRRLPLSAQELIANNAIHAGVVMPLNEQYVLLDSTALQDEPISVFHNGQIVGAATGGALAGGPLGSIAQLSKHLDVIGRRLLPGQIVLTGSLLPLYRVERGDRFEVRSKHLGNVQAFITEGQE